MEPVQAGDELLRLFVAIEFPDEVKHGITLLQRAEAERQRGFRWTPPAQLHLTMKFLGEIDDARVEAAWRAMESLPRIGACTLGFGAFRCLPDTRRPRVLALELTGDTERLAALQDGLEASFESHGFHRERRPFFPHVTIARRNEREPHRVAGLYSERPWQGMFVATQLSLIQSHLKPSGTVYETMASFPFG